MSSKTEPSTIEPPLHLSPLDHWHREHGATMVPFAGYSMPVRYGSIVAEHQCTRTAASLFDVSHMARFKFEGDGAERLLDHLLTRRISDAALGTVRYAMVCNADGGVLDDVLVSHVQTPSGKRYYLMVVNASNRDKIWRWLTPHVADFPTVTVSDRTDVTAMIAIQGPLAVDVCSRLFKTDPSRLKNYRGVVTEQMGKPVLVSRTGYTGEDGLELVVRADQAPRIWENLLLAGREHGFAPAGLGARDTLRMEAAMPLYGHELDETIDPITAGLSFACNLERSFIGDEALRQIVADGPRRKRIGLTISGKRPAREGCPVQTTGGEVVGITTSGGPSPTLGLPIAMAYVDVAHADQTQFLIDVRGNTVEAKQTPLPFYQRKRVD